MLKHDVRQLTAFNGTQEPRLSMTLTGQISRMDSRHPPRANRLVMTDTEQHLASGKDEIPDTGSYSTSDPDLGETWPIIATYLGAFTYIHQRIHRNTTNGMHPYILCDKQIRT